MDSATADGGRLAMTTFFSSDDQDWNLFREWTFELPEEEEPLCAYAQQFAPWANLLCEEAEKRKQIVSLNHAYVLLLHKYFEWRNVVPKNHRDRVSERGHICIFQIFDRAYHRLMMLQLSLEPILTSYPPAPPALPLPTPKQVVDVIFGLSDPEKPAVPSE
ncbi:MAG: hypothetical protein U0350_48725 [Caldilineaceae bacterium]